MDYKSFVNKESFKAILLQHLKNQVKTKFSNDISSKIQQCLENDNSISHELIVSSVSSEILESKEFPDFTNSFMQSVKHLLSDGGKYVPREEKHNNGSQCSSASSVNASSIDFLSPDQFQNMVASLTSGTNVERLEALGMLYRLPSLEHVTHQFKWSDVETGLYSALSSNVTFLKVESLRLYIKMLSCPEPKVVQDSYISLIKYFLNLQKTLNHKTLDSYFVDQCRCAVEILSILNKFLQTISAHWLRYPQSLIENITEQSLSVLTLDCNDSNTFPVWMCTAMCDPGGKWLKNLLHGHVSRAALLNALQKDSGLLCYAIEFCNKFCFDENYTVLMGTCCQKTHLVTEITHSICFLSHLLQYRDGREIFSSVLNENVLDWVTVINTVMNCTRKLCSVSCFSCCSTACIVVSKNWHCIFGNELASATSDNLFQSLILSGTAENHLDVNNLYFTLQCFCETVSYLSNIDHNCMYSNFEDFIIKLLTLCTDFYTDCGIAEVPTSIAHLYNSSLVVVKRILSIPSTLFLNHDFINILTKWWQKMKNFINIRSLVTNLDAVSKHGIKIVSKLDHNISDVSICLLRKPFGITMCCDASFFEASLDILLEKILQNIKTKNSVCVCDIVVLSNALNSGITLKHILNKITVFRLSSIMWELNEVSDNGESIQSLKCVLSLLLSSIFCDLFAMDMAVGNLNSEVGLYQHLLLFPNLPIDGIVQEDYRIIAFQIVSLLSSSIHSLCTLQAKFKVIELCLELQSQQMSINGEQVIDPVSILLNHVLVKMYLLGGPDERNLPFEMLETSDQDYSWPFVKELPVPEMFYHSIQHHEESDVDVESTELQGPDVDLKDMFLTYIHDKKILPTSVVFSLLKDSVSIIRTMQNFPNMLNFVPLDDVCRVLHEEELVGLQMVERYGYYLNVLSTEDEGKLEQLLNAAKCLLGAENSNRLDVFVCTIYLMCKGDIEAAFLFLQNFAKSRSSFFIWREHLIQSSKSCPEQFSTVHDSILELCDIIVKKTFPLLYSALQFHCILPSAIYNHWTMQCYWNYLDFAQVSNFVLLNVLYAGEYSLYFFASVLKHLHDYILTHAHRSELFIILKKLPILNFKISDYIDFINELSNTFHDTMSRCTPITNQENII